MNPSIQARFHSAILSDTDITDRLTEFRKAPVNYPHTRKILVEEGTITIQAYSNYLFFIEFYELDLHDHLKASFVVDGPTFFLFLMLDGHIRFSDAKGRDIAGAHNGIYYATYNRQGEYFIDDFSPGIHRLGYITPRSEWLETKVRAFSAMEAFIRDFRSDTRQYGFMPKCVIDKRVNRAVQKLYRKVQLNGVDMEVQILYQITKIFKYYNATILSGSYIHSESPKERIRLIKRYITENATQLKAGEIQNIADKFFLSRRTLTRLFKEHTGSTLREFIEYVKLDNALELVKSTELPIKSIGMMVGYPNSNHFSKVFKKRFGISPKFVRDSMGNIFG